MLLANCAPSNCAGSSFWSGAIWNSFAAIAGSISSGRATTSLQLAGAPTSATAFLLEREVDEVGRIVDLDLEVLHLLRRLERQGEVQGQDLAL